MDTRVTLDVVVGAGGSTSVRLQLAEVPQHVPAFITPAVMSPQAPVPITPAVAAPREPSPASIHLASPAVCATGPSVRLAVGADGSVAASIVTLDVASPEVEAADTLMLDTAAPTPAVAATAAPAVAATAAPEVAASAPTAAPQPTPSSSVPSMAPTSRAETPVTARMSVAPDGVASVSCVPLDADELAPLSSHDEFAPITSPAASAPAHAPEAAQEAEAELAPPAAAQTAAAPAAAAPPAAAPAVPRAASVNDPAERVPSVVTARMRVSLDGKMTLSCLPVGLGEHTSSASPAILLPAAPVDHSARPGKTSKQVSQAKPGSGSRVLQHTQKASSTATPAAAPPKRAPTKKGLHTPLHTPAVAPLPPVRDMAPGSPMELEPSPQRLAPSPSSQRGLHSSSSNRGLHSSSSVTRLPPICCAPLLGGAEGRLCPSSSSATLAKLGSTSAQISLSGSKSASRLAQRRVNSSAVDSLVKT